MSGNKKIKLLILTPTLQCGGSEKYVALLCNTIDTQQFEVTLAVLNNAASFYSIKNTAITIVDLKVSKVRSSLFKIIALAKKSKPDIIFSTANHLNLYLAVFKNFLPGHTPLIARESSVVSSNSKRAKLPQFYQWLLKKYYKRIDYIICQSAFMQNDLVNHFNIDKNKTVVIHNPVEATATLLPAPSTNKFITVARLSEEKGIDRLIRAVAKITVPFSYYIIGDGHLKITLQTLIDNLQLQDNIFLMGESKTPYAGMEDATLFLMGSHYEGFPNTLLEAGVLGIPAIAFDVPGGIAEIIKEGENGLLVSDGDEQLFANTIEKALDTNFDRRQIKEHIIKNFSATAIIKTTGQLLTQVYLHTNK